MTDPLSRARDEAEAFAKLQEATSGEKWTAWKMPVSADWTEPDSPTVEAAIINGPNYWPDPESTYWRVEDADFVIAARNTALPRLTLELAAECERLRELILAADRVTKERFTLDGMCDCIDNNGRPYQSDWATKIILALQEPPR